MRAEAGLPGEAITFDEMREAIDQNNAEMRGMVPSEHSGRITYDPNQAYADDMTIKRGGDLIYPGVREHVANILGIEQDEAYHELFNEVVN